MSYISLLVINFVCFIFGNDYKNSLMYHSILGPSLRQRFNSSKKPKLRYDSQQRFSSFQSLPASEHQLQEFSDYQSPPKKQKANKPKKQKSYILVEQLPLQYQSSAKRPKRKDIEAQPKPSKPQNYNLNQLALHQQDRSLQSKLNTSIKFNYMEQVNRQLSTIKQDEREYLRQSLYAPHLQRSTTQLVGDTSMILPHIPQSHPYHYFLDEEFRMQNRIQLEQQKLRTEELRLKNALVQQQNITLKQRIFFLESQLNRKYLQKTRDSEFLASKHNQSIEQQLQAARQQTKAKLLDQIANLQKRCQQMKEEMTAYKLKQQERLNNLLKQQQSRQHSKVEPAYEYHTKFAEVFLNMVEKLPINLPQIWSKKKKIAVGWKIVKHFVRKALKLGIVPPTVLQSDELR